jgi:hypothetical protein
VVDRARFYVPGGDLPADRLRACLDRLERDLDFFELRDLTLDLCLSLAMPIVSTPRSLDLAHLRTALAFHAERPLTRLITLDGELRRSAQEMGLPV